MLGVEHSSCSPVLVHGAAVLVGVHAEGKAVRGLEATEAAAVAHEGGRLLGRQIEQRRVHEHARHEGRVLGRH